MTAEKKHHERETGRRGRANTREKRTTETKPHERDERTTENEPA